MDNNFLKNIGYKYQLTKRDLTPFEHERIYTENNSPKFQLSGKKQNQ